MATSALVTEIRKLAKQWECTTAEARCRLLWLGLSQVVEPRVLSAVGDSIGNRAVLMIWRNHPDATAEDVRVADEADNQIAAVQRASRVASATLRGFTPVGTLRVSNNYTPDESSRDVS